MITAFLRTKHKDLDAPDGGASIIEVALDTLLNYQNKVRRYPFSPY
jgi:hypothetical protein